MVDWAVDHNVCYSAEPDAFLEAHIYQVEGSWDSILHGYPVIELEKGGNRISLSSAYGGSKENEIICSSVTVDRF
jgi:hypothetical protein